MFKILNFYFKESYQFAGAKFVIYCLFSTISSILQSIGIVSIFPIVTMLLDPEKIISNEYFIKYYFFNYSSNEELIYQLSFIFLCINIAGIIIFFLTYILGDLINGICYIKNKNELIKKIFYKNLDITSERSNVINYLLHETIKYKESNSAFIVLFATVINFACIIISILLLEPRIIYPLFFILLFYIFVFLFSKSRIINIAIRESKIAKKSNQIILYFSLALKDILSLNIGKSLTKNLEYLDNLNVMNSVKKKFFIVLPRYILEILLYFSAFLMIIYFFNNTSFVSMLPKLATITILVWRSLPIFFNVFRMMSTFNANITAYKNYNKISIFSKNKKKLKIVNDFKKSIEFKDVSFDYNNEKKFNFNFKIDKKDKVLVSGKSGSGKTTLLHLLTGFIDKKGGKIFLDKLEFDYKNFNTKIFGYVTQDIILFPGSLYENICLSKYSSKIDERINKVEDIFKICGLDNIVKKVSDLRKKKIEFDSPELSGGQKQRIGIARILMLNPSVLILDEATSALDKDSEDKIIRNIIKYYKDITIIAVSHRPLNKIFNKQVVLK